MLNFDVSEFNIVLVVLGVFILFYGIILVFVKSRWFLGEVFFVVVIGIIFGFIVVKFFDSFWWGFVVEGQISDIMLGMVWVVIGVQFVIVGFQLLVKYNLYRWKEMVFCFFFIMIIMWLCIMFCLLVSVFNIILFVVLVIGFCVICIDLIFLQVIVKGLFVDKFVFCYLCEIIFFEVGVNDGFGFFFFMFVVYFICYVDVFGVGVYSIGIVCE